MYSLDAFIKQLDKHLKEKNITIMDKHYKGDGYEFIIKLINDIDYPKHYKITIEEI